MESKTISDNTPPMESINREIKFRCWNGEEMLFVHQLDIYPDSPNCRVNCSVDSHRKKWPIMQFTGLRDKNGKKIYEGDVVSWREVGRGMNYPNPIEVSDRVGSIYYGDDLTWRINENSKSIMHLLVNNYRQCEVIGNVYENPELLTRKNQNS